MCLYNNKETSREEKRIETASSFIEQKVSTITVWYFKCDLEKKVMKKVFSFTVTKNGLVFSQG